MSWVGLGHDGVMTDTHRSIDLERTGPNALRATNARGTTLDLGDGSTDEFTPVELLLVALGGCSALTGDKIRDEHGSRLVNLQVTLDIALPEGEAGDAARAILDRTVEVGTPVQLTLSD